MQHGCAATHWTGRVLPFRHCACRLSAVRLSDRAPRILRVIGALSWGTAVSGAPIAHQLLLHTRLAKECHSEFSTAQTRQSHLRPIQTPVTLLRARQAACKDRKLFVRSLLASCLRGCGGALPSVGKTVTPLTTFMLGVALLPLSVTTASSNVRHIPLFSWFIRRLFGCLHSQRLLGWRQLPVSLTGVFAGLAGPTSLVGFMGIVPLFCGAFYVWEAACAGGDKSLHHHQPAPLPQGFRAP